MVTQAKESWTNDLKKLDEILQCSICYEFITTCMITPCSHNFCSLCIRKYLQFKTQCPTCYEETFGSDLRKNRPLDEVIAIYTKIKERLEYTFRILSVTKSVKYNTTDHKLHNSSALFLPNDDPIRPKDEIKTTPKKAKKPAVNNLFSQVSHTSEDGEIECKPIVIDGLTIPSIFTQQKSPKKNPSKKTENTAPCPVCEVDVPVKNLNLHLDSCLAISNPDPNRPKLKVMTKHPIPKRVYSMMKDRELKKSLKDFGLSMNGDRKSMLWRLNRYSVLYNAECDRSEPRPASEIRKQVEKEEREEKANPLFPPAKSKVVIDNKSDLKLIEKVNREYIDLNKDSFNKIIENMKAHPKPQRHNSNVPEPFSTLDNPQPSTSKASPSNSVISIHSQETICDSDCEVYHINWDKTDMIDEEDSSKDVDQKDPVEPDENKKSLFQFVQNSNELAFDKSTRSDVSKTPKVVIDKKSDPKLIEKVNKEYIDSNKDNFKKLIENMKERHGTQIKPLNALGRILSDDDDDDEEEEEKPEPFSTFDNPKPSTSKASPTNSVISIHSQETICDSDLNDMFQKTPVNVEAEVWDWTKTAVKDEEVDSDSYESVFDKSTQSDVSKTPVSRLSSMSAKKKSKLKAALASEDSQSKINIKQTYDTIFERTSGHTYGTKNNRNGEVSSSSVDDDDDDIECPLTPLISQVQSPESPVTTRSRRKSKRKDAPADENEISNRESRTTRSKRAKRSVSPCY